MPVSSPAAASGGVYDWNDVNGIASFSPDNSTSANITNFSSTTAGVYEVNVTYLKGGTFAKDTLSLGSN
jgi:hypothetical protein